MWGISGLAEKGLCHTDFKIMKHYAEIKKRDIDLMCTNENVQSLR